ncbi:hypothetical protein GH714_004128 [Hevea brasiliensis]|uniref:Transcription repressor n=1 Tax=Hevea brasiliensis TaxID=3981 RepID=A0A6A6LXV9_HEVBR|nr:hypothetical protein GH714_004128 [Hevea brasiliensis]
MNINSGKKHAKQKVKWNSVCTSSSRCVSSGGKFYGGDGDAFWRLSFGEESLDGLKSKNVLQSVRYNSDDDLEFPPSSYHSYRSKASRVNGTEQVQKLSNMVSQVRNMRRLPKEEEILPEPTCTKKESFAMVKCSYDPQKDFRDSMIEMIKEQRINQPEELEELLACYLTLNSDEYHDLIIRVFRQVWFDLNQACFDIEFTNEECY